MINEELLKEIEEYCKLNDLDVKNIINKALKKGFAIEKFGATPLSAKKDNKPVEVVKTVEKIVKVSNDDKLNKELDKLQLKINEQTKEIGKLTKEIDSLEKEMDKKDIYGE